MSASERVATHIYNKRDEHFDFFKIGFRMSKIQKLSSVMTTLNVSNLEFMFKVTFYGFYPWINHHFLYHQIWGGTIQPIRVANNDVIIPFFFLGTGIKVLGG